MKKRPKRLIPKIFDSGEADKGKLSCVEIEDAAGTRAVIMNSL